ncbi:MAG TPA: hypothetical protein PLN39_02830 [Candidatus Dojkabacteria bacterium]|nr:hypothetical protein [Candidatus Dojkabacteria bacterium]HRY74350.1 hypothetical protein [Candidatus Dojkabacteria bacterium]
MVGNEILDSINMVEVNTFDFNLLPLLKVPFILLLIGNLFFALILYLRIRILSDTFVTFENRRIKSIVVIYLIGSLVLSLFALLFLILS